MTANPPPTYRLLITRPAEDAARLAAALRPEGIEGVIEPLFTVVFDASAAPLDLRDVQALALTSVNGVRALAGRSVPSDVRVFAVGDGTARHAERAGFTHVESASGAVDDLAALILRRLDPKDGSIMHVAGSVVAGDLGGRLTKTGFAYERRVLYRAAAIERLSEQTRRALAAGDLDGVALYSPRTARVFHDVLAADDLTACCRHLTAFGLSAAVADAAAGVAWARTIVAERPDQPAMIRAIVTGAKRKGSE
jgi:uroporphyrinogen-III synthase